MMVLHDGGNGGERRLTEHRDWFSIRDFKGRMAYLLARYHISTDRGMTELWRFLKLVADEAEEAMSSGRVTVLKPEDMRQFIRAAASKMRNTVKDQVIAEYAKGASSSELKRRFGVGRTVILHWVRAAGIVRTQKAGTALYYQRKRP